MIYINRIGFDYKTNCFYDDICSRTPQINWTVTGNGKKQKSFCIVIKDGESTVFESGEIVSSVQSYTVDKALPADRELTLILTVTDTDGQTATDGSYIIICADDLTAPFIRAAEDIPNRPIIFSRRFSVEKTLKDAYLYVCGIGYYELALNGGSIYRHKPLNPATSDYSKTCYYNVINLGPQMITRKNNKIEITVADGWRRISSSFIDKNIGGRKITFDGIPVLSAQIRLYFEDRTSEIISTDESWQYTYGKITYANIFNGCRIDYTIKPKRPKKAVLFEDTATLGKMTLQLLQSSVYDNSFSPVAVFRCGEDYVYDFGQNIAGAVCIMADPATGCLPAGKITVLYGEMLNADGSIYTAPLREAECRDEFICTGNEEVIYPEFTYHGFRYAQISGLDGRDAVVYAELICTDMDKNGTFASGSALLDKIHKNAFMTEKDNMLSILTDCPQRDERMGWMNDATVRFEETPYNFDIGQMFPKIVRDILDAQSEDGAITCTAPFVFGARPADPVCSSFLVAGFEAYMHTGNTAVLKDGFDGFCKWEDYLLSRSDDYIVNYSYYGDWAAPSYACITEEFACSAVTPGILMSTGYSYFNCKLISEFASVLGYTDKAEKYAKTAENIAKAFCDKWVNLENGTIECGSMGAYAFALWLGILPESIRTKAAEHMRDDLVSRNYQFTTGNLTSRYILDMLAEYGYIDDAWKILTKTDYPSFGFEINHGATTIWERFELKQNPGMNSHNHPMYGAADYFLHAYLAGIKITEAGCRRISVKPYLPEGLCYCLDTVKTVLGYVSVKWVVEYGKKILYVSVPFGMEADIEFCGNKKSVGAGTHIISVPTE